MRNSFRWVIAAAVTAMLPLLAVRGDEPRVLVLDNARIIDGTGAAPIERGRIVVRGDRLAGVGPREAVAVPGDAETADLLGRTVLPGLIDLRFDIENDPTLAPRQLTHGVTSFS
jgi:adenine deaminase